MRRLFRGIDNIRQARECVRTIAGLEAAGYAADPIGSMSGSADCSTATVVGRSLRTDQPAGDLGRLSGGWCARPHHRPCPATDRQPASHPAVSPGRSPHATNRRSRWHSGPRHRMYRSGCRGERRCRAPLHHAAIAMNAPHRRRSGRDACNDRCRRRCRDAGTDRVR